MRPYLRVNKRHADTSNLEDSADERKFFEKDGIAISVSERELLARRGSHFGELLISPIITFPLARGVHEISKFILKSRFVRYALVELADSFFMENISVLIRCTFAPVQDRRASAMRRRSKGIMEGRSSSGHSNYARQMRLNRRVQGVVDFSLTPGIVEWKRKRVQVLRTP